MRKTFFWIGISPILLLMLTACAGETFDTTFIHRPDDLVSEGETIYLRNCARCHQLDGLGFPRIYPNLAGNPLVTLHNPIPVTETVLNGQGSMPGFKNDLSHEELASVISYIRSAWGNNAPAVMPRQTR
jgi:alcohol dehydrogenase (quinone), cytochrome c subunit